MTEACLQFELFKYLSLTLCFGSILRAIDLIELYYMLLYTVPCINY